MARNMSSTRLSQKELSEIQEAFSFYDSDRDGFLSISEVGKLMRAVGFFPSEAELASISKGHKNKIDFNEFLNILSKNMSENRIDRNQMIEAFKMFDQYGNGFVNLMQMRTALQNLGEKLKDDEIDELIREADIDSDGNVSYEELVRILCN